METTNKLPEDFKKKWVAALRSGEYKQCQHSMFERSMFERTEGGSYCCLGVASSVFQGKRDITSSDYDLMPEVIKGGYSNSVAKILMHMNDNQRKTFLEIADYIEDNL